MREIKFRAWDVTTQSFAPLSAIYLDEKTGANAGYIDDFGFVGEVADDKPAINQWVLEQYTGIKDIDDKPVYEGDVVQKVWFTEMPDGSINTTKIGDPIEVKPGNYAYGKWIAEYVFDRGVGVTDYVMADELIVLGNIHENPELLEGE